jgi:galacturan 1,4-alpha-galacturonidase
MVQSLGSLLSIASLAASASAVVYSPNGGKPVIERPSIKAWPLQPGKPHAASPRDPDKYCFVKPSCKSDDDAPNILKAFRDCNHGGTVVLDANYTIGSPLDLTFLDSIDVAISGTINFSGDVDYWVEHSFKYAYQDSSAMWRFGGKDVNIFGNGLGLINGNGQPWYDAFAADATLMRPILLMTDGLHGGSITGLRMINSPNASFTRSHLAGATLLTLPTVVQPHCQQLRHHCEQHGHQSRRMSSLPPPARIPLTHNPLPRAQARIQPKTPTAGTPSAPTPL